MKLKIIILGMALVAMSTLPARAVLYNQNVVSIFGSGNPDTGYVTDTAGGVTVALRGKDRTTGNTFNVGGVYNLPTGFAAPGRGNANVEFSFNTDPLNVALSGLSFWLEFDTDPSQGQSFNLLNLATIPDNSYGNAGTANGAGVEGLFALLGLANPIMQNSENQAFLGVNPLLDGTYDYKAYALSGGIKVVEADIRINLGKGGAPVPDNGTTLTSFGLASLGLIVFRKKLTAVAA